MILLVFIGVTSFQLLQHGPQRAEAYSVRLPAPALRLQGIHDGEGLGVSLIVSP